ncbi:MAG: hypothetical protein WCK89_22710 [bacterium]
MNSALRAVCLGVAASLALGARAAAPANDSFGGAIELPGDSGSLSGNNNIDATFETGEPECGATNTVWFKWNCTTDGTFTISTLGSTTPAEGEWDAILGVYTGASVDALTALPGTPQDTSYAETMTVTVSADTTYYIQLAGFNNDVASDILLTWSWSAPPPTGLIIDISNATTPAESSWPDGGVRIDDVVGAGNSGRLIGVTQTHWTSGGFSVDLDLNGNTLKINSGGGNYINASGAISGNGVVSVEGGGNQPIHISGSTGNTYSNTTVVTPYTAVSLEKSSGHALCGGITVTGPNNPPYTTSLIWTAPNQIEDTSDVTLVSAGAVLDLAGFSDTISNLYMVTGSYVQTGVGGVLKVAKLFLDDVEQGEVAYIAGDGFVLGSGYIEVGGSGPPLIEQPPSEPVNPAPTDGSPTVHPANLPKLDWADSSRASSYDVYLWIDSEPKPESPNANVVLSEYTLSSQVLSLSTYNWQVVANNTVGSTTGVVWTFTTVDRTLVAGNYGKPYTDFNHNLNYIVGVGNSGTLLGNFIVHWQGGPGSFSVPLDLNGFILNADTGGGNGGHVASGPISGTGSFVITHGPAGGAWDNIYTISGNTPNTYTGGTVINRGQVRMIKTAGVDALPATSITLGSAGETARLIWGASDQINDLAEVSVLLPTVTVPAPDANLNYLDLAGFSDTIASLTLPDAGAKTFVRTGNGGVLTVSKLTVDGVRLPSGVYTSISGFVQGTGSIKVPAYGTIIYFR